MEKIGIAVPILNAAVVKTKGNRNRGRNVLLPGFWKKRKGGIGVTLFYYSCSRKREKRTLSLFIIR